MSNTPTNKQVMDFLNIMLCFILLVIVVCCASRLYNQSIARRTNRGSNNRNAPITTVASTDITVPQTTVDGRGEDGAEYLPFPG